MTYGVRITLLGRRNGGAVPGIGHWIVVGKFETYTHARAAAMSWESDRDFLWRTRVVDRRRRQAMTPHSSACGAVEGRRL